MGKPSSTVSKQLIKKCFISVSLFSNSVGTQSDCVESIIMNTPDPFISVVPGKKLII